MPLISGAMLQQATAENTRPSTNRNDLKGSVFLCCSWKLQTSTPDVSQPPAARRCSRLLKTSGGRTLQLPRWQNTSGARLRRTR